MEMPHTDVAIIGAGLAGSTAAAMLGRRGIETIVVDPHDIYPSELRCEKLDEGQVELLRRTGLADLVLPATTVAEDIWIARFGRLLDKKPSKQRGIMYDALVGAMRAAIPADVKFVKAKATAISTTTDRQTVTLSDGQQISARLVVLSNGLNLSLRHTLGLERKELSRCHSITVGFDIAPANAPAFDFPALTYYPEHARDKAAFLTLFPVTGAMRANYCTYREMSDPWILTLRENPRDALIEVMPHLEDITGPFTIVGPLKIRPVDLYQTVGYLQPGIVVVGDAFSSSCPAAGTGAGKVLNDVERLCNVHIPAWLTTAGMATDKVSSFYADPAKRAYDAWSVHRAFELRSISIDPSFKWLAHRWARFLIAMGSGLVRRARRSAARASADVVAEA